jgi:putative ABC transport system permease protein
MMVFVYFKFIWRNLVRNKFYAVLNITGLALGISASLLILEYISLEKSVNHLHSNLPNIYRIVSQNTKGETWGSTSPGWGKELKKQFPEVTAYCRIAEGVANGTITAKSKTPVPYREDRIAMVDGNFFQFFDFKVISGDATALNKIKTAFISETQAKKYFGTLDPIGQQINVSNQFGSEDYQIAGVFQDITEQSDIRMNILLSLETCNNPNFARENGWANLDNLQSSYLSIYLALRPQTNVSSFENKANTFGNSKKKFDDGITLRFQAMKDMHLGNAEQPELSSYASYKYIYMLSIIAVLIILIAWANYINLSTANAFKRANEVGVRKVVGASRQQLIFQFMGEAVFLNVLALVLAIVLTLILQPFFNQMVNRDLSIFAISYTRLWILGLLLLVSGSLLSGAYSAFVLSNFKPIETLKGKITKSFKGIFLRRALVVFQFGISIALIIATILIYSQLQFMQNKDLGFSRDQRLIINGPEVAKDSTYKSRVAAFSNFLGQQPFITAYCNAGSVPGGWFNFSTGGLLTAASAKGDELKVYQIVLAADKYDQVFDMKMAAGRAFVSADLLAWNDVNKIMLNEAAMRQLGFTDPHKLLQTPVKFFERDFEVIGVIKDYHHTGLQQTIQPIVYYPQNNTSRFVLKINTENVQAFIPKLEQAYKSYFAGNAFEYTFLDESFARAYITERQYSQIFTVSAIWAIIIACLGLLGLATYSVETRIKEIGVRKVLGASVSSIVTLISKDFMRLVLIAFIIASPIAWYFMRNWLQDFPYRISISWTVFLAAGVLAFLIAIITIGSRSIKAAIMNPVKSLRTE